MRAAFSFSNRRHDLIRAAFAQALNTARQAVLVLVLVGGPSAGQTADTISMGQRPKEATELTLEELMRMEIPTVYGASKYEQKITEAPSSVTIITTNQIQRYGYRTLAEILQSVRGFYVTYDRNYSLLGIRGFNRGDYNSRMLLLIDGHRVNNSLSDGGYLGTEFILDVDLIERVEVIRGPGSALYGNNAFFSVVNVVTKRGDYFNGPEVSGEVASFDTYKGRLTYGNTFRSGLEMLFSGSLYDSDGPGPDRSDFDHFGSLFGTLGYHDFTLQGAFNSRAKAVPTLTGTVLDNPKTRTDDERSYVNFKYAHEFAEVVDVTAQVYYDRHDFVQDALLDIPGLPRTLNRQFRIGEWWGSELQFTKRVAERHTFTLGAEYREDFRQLQRNFDVEPPSPDFLNTNRFTHNYGIYFQGDIAILTNLHFVGGVRYDKYGGQDPTANPRLALIYNPVEQTVFKAIYGTAFRAPNFIELREKSPSKRLIPETITSYELVYEQEISHSLRSSVSLFYNQIDDIISLQPDPQGGNSYQNVKGADAKGAEAEVQAKAPWGLISRLSYTYQETENRQTGETLIDSPRHLAKLNVSVPLFKDKFFAGLECQYTSKRKTLQGGEAGDYGIVNFTLFSRNLLKGLEVSASIYNLLDRSYAEPATPFHRPDVIPQDGRSFRVKLAYRY